MALDAAPLPDDTDARSIRLMQRVRAGDEVAFRELVELHQGSVIGTCARMLGSAGEAEDVAQLVFLRVWKAAPRYEPTAKFTTWLFTIVRHLVFNETRRRGRQPTVSLEASTLSEQAPREYADPSAKTPEATAMQAELEQAIDAAIAELPEQQRLAVICRRYEDMAYEDIAVVLKTTVPAVKSLLFRARTQLREKLQSYLQE